MTIDFGTALVVCALIASILLVLQGDARFVPLIALVACAIEALIVFRVIQLSSPKLRIDVILPAVLVVTGGIAWSRAATKSAATASTAFTTYERSGSLVFRSGVGTQMSMASMPARAAISEVARSRPAPTGSATSSAGTSGM